MRYTMHVYKNYRHTKNQKVIRFVYKYPLFKRDDPDHFTYFNRACSRYMKDNFQENDVYMFDSIKRVGGLKIWWMNLFLPVTNKIIIVPTMGSDNSHLNDEYLYFCKNGDDWWKIAKRKLGSGSKMYELAEYNGATIRKKLEYGDIVKIPFRLVNID